jgi:hypothetical protein
VVDNSGVDLPIIARAVKTRGWDWVTLLDSPRNGGFGYGNNLGIAEACRIGKPSYVYLLNPDATVLPGAIKTLVTFLECNPNAAIAGTSYLEENGAEWPITFRFPNLAGELVAGLSLRLISDLLQRYSVAQPTTAINQQVDWICGASMMIRPIVLDTIGGFDENYFLYFEETDLCLRARRAGFQTWYVPAARAMHIAGHSTKIQPHITGKHARLPSYWFESRRRYFVVNHGIPMAVAFDLVTLAAYFLGDIKARLRGKQASRVPYFVHDVLRHSVIWCRNRCLAPIAFGPLHPDVDRHP